MVWRNLIRKKLNKWVQHKLYAAAAAAAAWAFSDRRQGGPKGSLARSPVPGSSKSFTFLLLVYLSASYTAQASEPCSPVTESGQAPVQGRFCKAMVPTSSLGMSGLCQPPLVHKTAKSFRNCVHDQRKVPD